MKKRKCCWPGILFMLLFMLPICGVNANAASKKIKKETLNTSVKNFMKQAKAFNLKGIRSRVADFGEYELVYTTQSSGDAMYKYYKKCAKKMTYKVLSKQKKDKNTYVVKLRVRYVNSRQFTEKLVEKMSNDMLSGKLEIEKMLEMSEKELLKYANSLVRYADKSVKKTKYRTQTIKITFVRKGNKWKVKKMTRSLDNVLEANVPASLEKMMGDLFALQK